MRGRGVVEAGYYAYQPNETDQQTTSVIPKKKKIIDAIPYFSFLPGLLPTLFSVDVVKYHHFTILTEPRNSTFPIGARELLQVHKYKVPSTDT